MNPITVTVGARTFYVEFAFAHFPPPDYKVIDGKYRRLVVTDETTCYISATAKVVDGRVVTGREFHAMVQCSIRDDYNYMTGCKKALERATSAVWFDLPTAETVDGPDGKIWDAGAYYKAFARQVMPMMAALKARPAPSLRTRHKMALDALRNIAEHAENATGNGEAIDSLYYIARRAQRVPGVVIPPPKQQAVTP